jgi:hypothetical protein
MGLDEIVSKSPLIDEKKIKELYNINDAFSTMLYET